MTARKLNNANGSRNRAVTKVASNEHIRRLIIYCDSIVCFPRPVFAYEVWKWIFSKKRTQLEWPTALRKKTSLPLLVAYAQFTCETRIRNTYSTVAKRDRVLVMAKKIRRKHIANQIVGKRIIVSHNIFRQKQSSCCAFIEFKYQTV